MSRAVQRLRCRIPLLCGGLFLLTAVIAVASAWSSGNHLYDLGISFSAYVGLQRWTSVLYFCTAAIMTGLLAYYVAAARMHLLRKLVYAVIFLNITGTAWFPFNTFSDAPTPFTIDLHNAFAIALMLAVTVSFILTAVLAKSAKQRIPALCSLLYAGVFILLYFLGIPALFMTFFIWENLFILLLLIELQTEQYGEPPDDQRK